MKKSLLGILALVVGLQFSCASKAGTGTAIGAGGGAALGAGIGALIGGKKGALIGGAVGVVAGGATGAAIGSYMDKQEKKMREKVKNASIERVGDNLVVRFQSGILFDTGKADLKSASQTDLTEFSKVLAEYPQTNIVVEGHTDSTGSKATNAKLSEQRAKSVTTFLASNGVTQARVQAVGLADTMPVADNTTDVGRQSNRRVEVKISPNEELMKQATNKK